MLPKLAGSQVSFFMAFTLFLAKGVARRGAPAAVRGCSVVKLNPPAIPYSLVESGLRLLGSVPVSAETAGVSAAAVVAGPDWL